MLGRCVRSLEAHAAWVAAAVQPAVSTGLLQAAADAASPNGADALSSRRASGSTASCSQHTSSSWQCCCGGLSPWSQSSLALDLMRSMSTSARPVRTSSRHASRDGGASSNGGGSSSGREQRGVLGGSVVPFRIQKRAPVPAHVSNNGKGWARDQPQLVRPASAPVQLAKQEGRAGAVTANELMARIQSTTSLLDLEEVLADGTRSFTHKHLGAVASRVPPLVRASAGDLGAPRQLARLMAALEHLHVRAMHMLPARSIAHLLWAATKVQHHLSERTLLSCTQQLLSEDAVGLKDANGADLSLIAWGLAWQRMEAPAVWDAITEAALLQVDRLAPQSLSTLASAFADADRFDQPLMEAVSERALAVLHHFQPMQLIHLAWAFSKLNCPDVRLFSGIQAAIIPRLGDVNSRALGMLLSAYTHTLHPGATELLTAAEPHVLGALGSATPFTLNNVAAAYAAVGGGGDELWAALCGAAAGRLQSYSWSQLEMLLRVLRHRATPALQDAVASRLHKAVDAPAVAAAVAPEDAHAVQQVLRRLAASGHSGAAALQAAANAVFGSQQLGRARHGARHEAAAATG